MIYESSIELVSYFFKIYFCLVDCGISKLYNILLINTNFDYGRLCNE